MAISFLLASAGVLWGWGGGAVPSASLQETPDLIGEDVVIAVFKGRRHPGGSAMVEIPFKEDVEGSVTFTVSFDIDGDGFFEGEEVGVDAVTTVAKAELPSAFPVLFSDAKQLRRLIQRLKEGSAPVRVVLEDVPEVDVVTEDALATRVDVDISDAFHNPPPGFTGGWGDLGDWGEIVRDVAVPTAVAGGPVDIYNADIPDLKPRKGKPNECFPIASANSLLWIAKKHRFEDKMPATSDALLDELDEDVGWTKKGTEDAKMLDGKNAFTRRHGISLSNKKIDNVVTDGKSDLWDKIVKELQAGEDVELMFKKKETSSAKGTSGHAVTVVGANNKKGKQYVVVHDPLTREGNDTYEVARDGRLVGYSALGGKFFVEFIISESYAP